MYSRVNYLITTSTETIKDKQYHQHKLQVPPVKHLAPLAQDLQFYLGPGRKLSADDALDGDLNLAVSTSTARSSVLSSNSFANLAANQSIGHVEAIRKWSGESV